MNICTAAAFNQRTSSDKCQVWCPAIGFLELMRVALFLRLGKELPDVRLDEIHLTFRLKNYEVSVEQYSRLNFRGYSECQITYCPGLHTYLDGTIWTFGRVPPDRAMIYLKAREFAEPYAQRIFSHFFDPF